MSRRIISTVPQIITFSRISPDGRLKIKKSVMEYLQATNEQSVFLRLNDEILLSTKGGSEQPLQQNNYIELPKYVLDRLNVQTTTDICFLQRTDAIAIKRFDVVIKNGLLPKIFDIETPYAVVRQVETFGNPDQLKDDLESSIKGIRLEYNLHKFWKGKFTFHAWKARGLLHIKEDYDDELRDELIQTRLTAQLTDGSWDELVTATAKNLLELTELGMNSNYPQMQKGIKWLLDRPESPHNPGMFFLTDELVEEQQEVVQKREMQENGQKERFRKRPKSELQMVTIADPLYHNPCGPRIMWPNAIVLETLLALGYEYHERVHTIFNTLAYNGWCECGYQHGESSWRTREPMSIRDIEKFEERTKFEFLYGGIGELDDLVVGVGSWNHMKRITEATNNGHQEYGIWMPTYTQGCEVITTGALGKAQDERIWRLAEAHLWRFAIVLFNALNNPIALEYLSSKSLSPFTFLKVFSKFDNLPARLGILFLIPWLIDTQNTDGSWGEEAYKESATLAVINALRKVGMLI